MTFADYDDAAERALIRVLLTGFPGVNIKGNRMSVKERQHACREWHARNISAPVSPANERGMERTCENVIRKCSAVSDVLQMIGTLDSDSVISERVVKNVGGVRMLIEKSNSNDKDAKTAESGNRKAGDDDASGRQGLCVGRRKRKRHVRGALNLIINADRKPYNSSHIFCEKSRQSFPLRSENDHRADFQQLKRSAMSSEESQKKLAECEREAARRNAQWKEKKTDAMKDVSIPVPSVVSYSIPMPRATYIASMMNVQPM